ncbi:hypothetical protein BH09PLA1_BH09PLA1_09580 [soil metagenome]
MRKSAAALRIALAVLIVLLAIALLFRWDRQLHTLEDTSSRVLLSLLGLAVGAWMLRVLSAGARKLRKTTLFGAGALLISQICYHGIVWADWKRTMFVWRTWWISVVVATLTTHLVWLHFVGADQKSFAASRSRSRVSPARCGRSSAWAPLRFRTCPGGT